MRLARMLQAVDAHAAGEPGRVIVGGVLDVPGGLALGVTIYLMIRFLPLSLLWLVAGFSLLPLAALVRGPELALRATSPTADALHDHDPVG